MPVGCPDRRLATSMSPPRQGRSPSTPNDLPIANPRSSTRGTRNHTLRRVASRLVAEVDDIADTDFGMIRPARGPIANERAIRVRHLASLAGDDDEFERHIPRAAALESVRFEKVE